MFFKHFASKNQPPGFYISRTLVENGLKWKVVLHSSKNKFFLKLFSIAFKSIKQPHKLHYHIAIKLYANKCKGHSGRVESFCPVFFNLKDVSMSSIKLFWFLRYSFFCIFPFPLFPDLKGQMKLKQIMLWNGLRKLANVIFGIWSGNTSPIKEFFWTCFVTWRATGQ